MGKAALLAACVFCAWAAYPAEKTPGISGDIVVFHAGSLAVPLEQMAQDFTAAHPSVKVLREAAGSRDCARKISDLGRPCDVLAVADYAVIDTLLVPKYAEWNAQFAGNEMAVVYDEGSRGATEISKDNWFQVLLRDDVAFGRSEPDADPCGYRAILTMKLAERHYEEPGLAEKLLAKDRRYIRPKETELLALLETHTIDYIFLYRSVAIQHGLKYLTLPDQINLKRPDYAGIYKTVSTEISGKAPGERITVYGEPMVYGVTIPKNAPNPDAAAAFVAFLLDKEKGLAIMEKNGQPAFSPCPTECSDKVPKTLMPYVRRP